MSVETTLAQLKVVLDTITNTDLMTCGSWFPSDDVVIPAVFIDPDDFLNESLDTELMPIVLLSKALDYEQRWFRQAFGAGAHEYFVQIKVLCAKWSRDAVDQRRGEMAMRGWPKILADKLYAKQSLNSNVQLIGNPASGGDLLNPILEGIVTHREGEHIEEFSGLVAYLKVREGHQQTMTP